MHIHLRLRRPTRIARRAFTLVELLIAITIVAMLSALGLGMLRNVAEYTRIDRTRTIIAKLDTLIMERYNSYLTRRVPIRIYPGTDPQDAMYIRLCALRELMRMELPDRVADLSNGPQRIPASRNYAGAIPVPASNSPYILQQPAAWKSMRRRATATWLSGANPHESAECLYLIISSMNKGDRFAIDSFSSSEIGDIDNDGMLEIHDAWGQPIQFLRWAPDYTIENGVTTTQTRDASIAPDPFDPVHIDHGWSEPAPLRAPYALKPLIYSAGADRLYDINAGSGITPEIISYSGAVYKNFGPSYPYFFDKTNPANSLAGRPEDADGDGSLSYYDNITNHYVETP